ncbi:MAG: FecR family protein, partial [Bacteroidota bacterium]
MDKYRNNQSISEKANQLIGHYQIKANSGKEEVLDTILNKIEAENKFKEKPIRKINWFAATAISAAATVALLVVFYFFTATQTISAPEGETFSYRLPDESRVVLHDGSTIEIGKYYRKRHVALTGKAYFEIVKGEGFTVETANGDIEVLGTRFLVADFDKQLKVQCFQGKVKTKYNNNSWILEPGTQFSGSTNSAAKEKLEGTTEYPE